MIQLRKYRKAKHLTQQQLADMVGVSRSALGMWEIGKSEPSNEMLASLCSILEVSVDALLGHEEKPALSEEGEPNEMRKMILEFYRTAPDSVVAEGVKSILDRASRGEA